MERGVAAHERIADELGRLQAGGIGMEPVSAAPNEALLLAAWGREAAGSLRSRAAIMIGRRSRAPRR